MKGQLVLFAPPNRPREPKTTSTQPAWTTYSAQTRAKCVDCLLECAKTGVAAKPAQRRLRAPGVDVLVCHAHAIARGDSHLRRRHRAAG